MNQIRRIEDNSTLIFLNMLILHSLILKKVCTEGLGGFNISGSIDIPYLSVIKLSHNSSRDLSPKGQHRACISVSPHLIDTNNTNKVDSSIEKLNLPSLPSNFVVKRNKGLKQLKARNINIDTPDIYTMR